MHHRRARQYWDYEAAEELVFCRVTALALLRLLTNPRVLGKAALDGGAAWQALATWLATPGTHFLGEPRDSTNVWRAGAVNSTCGEHTGPRPTSPPSRQRAAPRWWPWIGTASATPACSFSISTPECKEGRMAITNYERVGNLTGGAHLGILQLVSVL